MAQAESGRTVLVVDDDARSLELVRLVLAHAGYRVLAAPDGATARELIVSARPDLTLADLTMPGVSGLDLCAWARATGAPSAMKFVLLTGMDDEQTRRSARSAGADDVIVKPFDRAGLLARVGQLLGS